MVLPAIGALLARIVGSRLIGAVTARVVGARAATAALTRLPLVPLERMREAATAGAGNRIAASLKGVTAHNPAAPRAFSNAINSIFARPTQQPGQRPPTVVQRIQNVFRGGPQGPPQAPPGAVTTPSPMAGITGHQFQSLAGGLAPGAAQQQQQQPTGPAQQFPSVAENAAINLAKFGSVAGVLAVTTKKLADVQTASLMGLSRYSTELSASAARARIASINRDRQSAANVGPSTAALNNAISDLNDTLRPLKDSADVLVNSMMLPMIKGMEALAKMIERQLSWFGINLAKPKNKGGSDWEMALRAMAAESKKGRHPIIPNPRYWPPEK